VISQRALQPTEYGDALRSEADEDAIALPKPVKNWLGFRIVDQSLGGDAQHISST
jgi:hypothetical protein